MRRDTSLDVIRFATLLKDGRCSEDDIRRAILSSRVKPIFHIDELHTAFKRWAEDWSTLDYPNVLKDDDDEPYEFFNGYVYLEINKSIGFLDCDFYRFTKLMDVEARLCPLPQYSLVEHVSMEDVIRQGGLTKSDAELLEQPLPRKDSKPVDSSPALEMADNTSDKTAGPRPVVTSPRFSMTRAALIDAHKHEWSTIERDISDASSNGLDAAKAGPRSWNEAIAMEWAQARGKLKKSSSELAVATHNMASLSSRTHKLKG